MHVIGGRRWAGVMLSLLRLRRNRLIFAVFLACAAGPLFAYLTDRYVERWPRASLLEYDPGTVYISRYLGRPLEESGNFEADPADAPTQPNLDRFYRTIAAHVQARVSSHATDHAVYVLGLGACWGEGGWPFVSRDVSYVVVLDQYMAPKRRSLEQVVFRADESGHDPYRPSAWWANAGVGSLVSAPILFGALTLIASLMQGRIRPVAGFPVIVPD